jgi:hypothetical protein
MRSCWLWYRMHMNDEELRNWIYPLMVKGANHAVQNFLRQDADGVYHTSNSQNPEHKGGPDCTFALANIRWLLQTLIESANRLDIDEPQLPIWQDILDNLVPYHTHENDGLMISETSRLERAHRHFSHLFPLYYGLLNFNEVSQRNLGNKSLEHFLTVGGPGGDRTGYTFGAASAMFSRLNRPEEAYEHLRYLVLTVFKPNATYREGGGPVSETAYASAGWTQELFLQQQGAAIALFPGFPPSEPDAVFHNLAAEGAFRVSAVRDGGSTAWVHVRSLAGEPCVVRGNFQGTPGITGSDGVGLEALGGNTWRVTGLEEGEWALLYRGATPPTNPTVSPLDGSVDEYNYFGSDRAKDTNVPVYPEVNIRTGSGATVNF